MEIKTKNIALHVEDGSQMDAYVARPDDSEKHPALMVFQEAFGVNPYIRNICNRLAKEGYMSLAPELFHRTHPGFEGSYTNFDPTPMTALTDQNLEKDIASSFDWLKNSTADTAGKIASIGFCMGGRVSFLANSLLPLKAAISFYGGNIAPSLLPRAKNLSGPMLFFWGGQDKHILPEHYHAVENELRITEKIYVNTVFSDADHGFFCDARASYKKEAADEAWGLTLQFLKTYLKK